MTAGGPLLSRPTGHTLRGTLRDLALEEINLRTGHLSPELAEDVEEHDKEDEEQRHHQHRRRAAVFLFVAGHSRGAGGKKRRGKEGREEGEEGEEREEGESSRGGRVCRGADAGRRQIEKRVSLSRFPPCTNTLTLCHPHTFTLPLGHTPPKSVTALGTPLEQADAQPATSPALLRLPEHPFPLPPRIPALRFSPILPAQFVLTAARQPPARNPPTPAAPPPPPPRRRHLPLATSDKAS